MKRFLPDFTGLNVSICQMNVIPGRPDLNGIFIRSEIRKAIDRKVDILILPEMCVSGYIIGDKYEDNCFIEDVQIENEEIREATAGSNIIVIFGSVLSVPDLVGEDGRLLKCNAAFIAQNGSFVNINHSHLIRTVVKSLQPNYRMYDDDRHFVSLRKLVGILRVKENNPKLELEDLLQPIILNTRLGRIVVLLITCEDMWDPDYAQKVLAILLSKVDSTAGEKVKSVMIIDISCSHWSWQKNRKRHSVVREHLMNMTGKDITFVYVNNTGTQNNGKNEIIFDGGSTIYNSEGQIIFEAESYVPGTFDFFLTKNAIPIIRKDKSDTEELYAALDCAARSALARCGSYGKKMVVAVSGGWDSSLAAAQYARILHPENMTLVSLPTMYNEDSLNGLSAQLAENIGVKDYRVIPFQEQLEMFAKICGVKPGDPAYENMQPKIRMTITSTIAQAMNAVFPCNMNKVEAAFGWTTRYGDLSGFCALYGDLVKREEYQVGDFLNKEIYGYTAIPQGCFDAIPTGGLRFDQPDPFDYGNLDYRGFHDEFVRGLTEFRLNPQWFLERYIDESLEYELKLNPGHLGNLFPTAEAFILELEHCWDTFHYQYPKRVITMGIPIVSKRAFGFDLRESDLTPHYTRRYKFLKERLLGR